MSALRALGPGFDLDVVAAIDVRLRTVAARENAEILLAVESGSRAWGFRSADSDYDSKSCSMRCGRRSRCAGCDCTRARPWHPCISRRWRRGELPADIAALIDDLLVRKAVTRELGTGPLPAAIGELIDVEFATARERWPSEPWRPEAAAVAEANAFLRSWVRR